MLKYKPRKVLYKNIEMCSRLEADTAKFFDEKNINWQYTLSTTAYVPKFQIFLEKEEDSPKIFIEMKPKQEMFEQTFIQMEILKEEDSSIFICGTANWNEEENVYDNFYFSTNYYNKNSIKVLQLLNQKNYVYPEGTLGREIDDDMNRFPMLDFYIAPLTRTERLIIFFKRCFKCI